jgi:aspartate racemase
MGPEATVDLMRRVIALTPAADDQDHVRMLVDNNPRVPSRIAALIHGTGPSPLPVLIDMARGLEAMGADFLVMPCNTAHHYHAQIAAAVSIPFLNLMELVVEHLRQHYPTARRVGLLASSALARIRLYEPWLEAAGVELLYPPDDAQAALMTLIGDVKAGRAQDTGTEAFLRCAATLEQAGADVLLIACTELSVIAAALEGRGAVLDAADVLARAVVARALATPG